MATGAPLLDARYQLDELIGRGGMARVYSATDLWLRRRVAVKLFRSDADETTVARLEIEGKLLASLSHPGLLRVFDISTTDGRPYLVMELVEGYTLRRLISRPPLPPDMVAGLGVRLAETLDYVHSRHVVHRDIKPSNVLVDESGTCFLGDFGIARAMGAARLTASGRCVGTAAYLAPEQVAGDEVGAEADVYSLGLVLLECLTGEPEYPGPEVEAALARLTRSPRVPDDLPSAWRELLPSMTARDPRDRPDAGRCAELLWAAADPRPPVIPTPRPIPDPPTVAATAEMEKPGRRARRWPAASVPAAVLGLATATLGALLWTTGPESATPVGETGTPAPAQSEPTPAILPPAPAGSAADKFVVPPTAERPAPEPASNSGKTGQQSSDDDNDDDSGKGKRDKDNEDEEDDDRRK